MAQGARADSIMAAVEGCKGRLKELRAEPDPRNSEARLVTLSSWLVDLVEGLSRPEVEVQLSGFSNDPPGRPTRRLSGLGEQPVRWTAC
jgi:hypothetical protein